MSISVSAPVKEHQYPSLPSFIRSLDLPMAFLPFAPEVAREMHDVAAVQLREAVERRDAKAVEKILTRLENMLRIDLDAFLNERPAKGFTYLEEAVKVQPRWMLRSKTAEEQARERRKKNSSLRLVEILVEKGADHLEDAAGMTRDPAIAYYLRENARRRRIERSAQNLLFYLHDRS
ncbi:MAG: hypothetical protein LVQ95_02230 [Candidatus Micrarchaeales archaeon]|nr:hypothetical protein [Candidatus Micrarchaeales archaeon]